MPAFLAGDKTFLREVMHPANDAVDLPFSVAHASLEVGETSLPHSLGQTEVYYILSGQGRLVVEEESIPLSAGGLAIVPSGARQSLENTGAEPIVFLCIVSPPWTAENETIYPTEE